MPATIVTHPAAWIADLLDVLGSSHRGAKWQCPAHGMIGDHQLALVVREGDEGTALLYCHGGCGWRDVLRALSLPATALRQAPTATPAAYARAILAGAAFPPVKDDRGGDGGGWVATSITEHPYGDPTTWAWKVRERNAAGVKRMRWESLNPRGERVPGLLGRSEVDMPLYLVREVRKAVALEELVVLVESESSVDALVRAGLYATTWAGGASSAPVATIARELAEARVLLVPDYDDPGLACAERIVRALPTVRVQLGEPDEDARDVLARAGAGWFR